MPQKESQSADYATIDFILGALAEWINKYRNLTTLHDEFQRCSPDEVRQIAKDLSVPLDELRSLASKGPGSAALLEKLLLALRVDPELLMKTDPATMRDMQRLCVNCRQKRRCEHELAAGTAADQYRSFCPNAFTLDALFAEKTRKSCH